MATNATCILFSLDANSGVRSSGEIIDVRLKRHVPAASVLRVSKDRRRVPVRSNGGGTSHGG